jgi:hypothetical protein
MNVSRAAAVAAVLCLGGLSVTACSGGITPVSSSTTPPPSSSAPPASSPASSPATTPSSSSTSSAGATISGDGSSISVGGSAGNFPVPPGATVLYHGNDGAQLEIVLSGVTASEVSSYYTGTLPSDGYTITSNATGNGDTFTGVGITFTGHGYNGKIGALSGVGINNVGSIIAGTGGNLVGIDLDPQ